MVDSYRPDRPNGHSRNPRDGSLSMYRFGGGNYRPSGGPQDSHREDYLNSQSDFTFRPGTSAPTYPRNIPQRNETGALQRNERVGDSLRRFDRQSRIRYRRPGPSERPILKSSREKTPEQLNGDDVVPAKFQAVNDMSESETDMELDSGMEESDEGQEEDLEPSRKKFKTQEKLPTTEPVSRWSNPDPYTSLPPPDESKAKKKDVVKLIRKAKISKVEEGTLATNDVTENADFISLNFDDDKNDVLSIRSSSSEDALSDFMRNVPKGPRSFSHLDKLHPERSSAAPGTDSRPRELRGSPPRKQFIPSMDARETAKEAEGFVLKEEGAPMPPKTRKRKRQGFEIDGSIVEEWASQDLNNASPWCESDHGQTDSMGLWLHKEICDFYDYVKPKDFERIIRNDLVRRVEDTLSGMFRRCRVLPFGSFASGLYLPVADMDLVVVSPEYEMTGRPQIGQSKSALYRISGRLEMNGTAQADSCEVIASAKVPIVKFVDRRTGLKVDISFENMTGVIAISTFEKWKAQHPSMPILTTLLKQFLLMRGLNEVFTGGLGGFTVTCLVTSLLQNLPSIQSGNVVEEHNLGELLMNFFDLYGNKLNTNSVRISMNPPGYLQKDGYTLAGKLDNNPDRLSIIDPNKPGNDISNGSHKIELVQKCFSEAYARLQQRMHSLDRAKLPDRKKASILSSIIGGDYSSFQWQRHLLKKVYESK